MNDLVRLTPIDGAVEKQLTQLAMIRSEAKSIVEKSPEDAVKLYMLLEASEALAQSAKLKKLELEYCLTKLEVAKQLGAFIKKNMEKGNPKLKDRPVLSLETIGVSRRQSANWQRLSMMPVYVWNYGMKLSTVPHETTMVREYRRYIGLKKVIEISNVKDKPETLKIQFERGLSVDQAEVKYLKKPTKEIAVEQDTESTYAATPADQKVEYFGSNVIALGNWGQEVINFLDDSDEISKKLWKEAVASLKEMIDVGSRISKAFLNAKSKVK
jgi:hypothetical protein